MTDQQPPAAPGDPQPYGVQPYAPQPYPGADPYADPAAYGDPGAYGAGYGAPAYGAPAYAAPAYGAPAYGGPAAGAPYGYDPVSGQPWSEKTRATAGLLSLLLPFVGVCGVGRLYAGQTGIGLAQLLGFFLGGLLLFVLIGFVIVPAVWIWSVVDGIVLLANGGRDGHGRPLR